MHKKYSLESEKVPMIQEEYHNKTTTKQIKETIVVGRMVSAPRQLILLALP